MSVREAIELIPSHARALERGELVHMAYELGRARTTGVLTIYVSGRAPEVLVVRRGHLMTAETDALGRQTGRRLAHLASLSGVRYTFELEPASDTPLERQFSLAAWARSYIEAELDPAAAQALVATFTGVRLVLVPANAPDPGLCDATDARILEALAQPRRLDQIWHHARTPRFRLLSFLYFLRSLGALDIVPGQAALEARSHEDARRLLGVAADADRAALKRAYYRLARALHPDLHPEASDDDRRSLERKLAAITDAYVQLTSSSAA